MAEPASDRSTNPTFRICAIDLDEQVILRRSADAEHERRVAIFDLIEGNYFRPVGSQGGPYHVLLGVEENRLSLEIALDDGSHHGRIMLSLTPFRRIIKDYFMICETYYNAIRNGAPQQIEAIDMGRRSLHNEGSELLRQRLEGKIEVDFDTARRLFTLICVLHIKS